MIESEAEEGQGLVRLAKAAGRDLLVYDLEHTGGAIENFGITELAFLRIKPDGSITKGVSLINPERPINPFISNITGIWPDMVKDSPVWRDLGAPFVSHNQDAVWVGFNSRSSDASHLRKLHTRDGLPALHFPYQIDVMRMANQMGHKGKLSEMTETHAPHAVHKAHRAYADVLMTAALLEVWVDYAISHLDTLLNPAGISDSVAAARLAQPLVPRKPYVRPENAPPRLVFTEDRRLEMMKQF